MINNPLDVPNCVVWLDGADSTTMGQLCATGTGDIADKQLVGLWKDKTTGKEFYQNGSNNRPCYIEQLSCLNFTFANSNNSLSYINNSNPIVYTQQTTFAVVEMDSGIQQDYIYTQSEYLSSGLQGYTPLMVGASFDHLGRIFVGSQANRNDNWLQASYSTLRQFPNKPTVLCSKHTGTQILNFVDGRPAGLSNSVLNENAVGISTVGVLSASNTTIGTNFNGKISEIISYDRALSDKELTDVFYYLARKWSPVVGRPFERNVYPTETGNWSTINWSASSEPVPWNKPLPTDWVYTGTNCVVNIDTDVKVDSLVHRDPYSGLADSNYGTFRLTNGVSLSADLLNVSRNSVSTLPSHRFVTIANAASAEIVGTFYTHIGGTNDSNSRTASNYPLTLSADGTSQLTVRGNVTGYPRYYTRPATRTKSIEWLSSSPLIIYGDVIGGHPYVRGCIENYSSGNIYVYGNVYGTQDPKSISQYNSYASAGYGAIRNMSTSTGSIFISGDVHSGYSNNHYGIYNESNTGNVYINGNIRNAFLNSTNVTAGIRSNSSTTTIFVTGNVYGAEDTLNDNLNFGIYSTGSSIRVNGNVYGGSIGASNAGIASNSANIIVNGNVIGRGAAGIRCTSNTQALSVFYTDKGIVNGYNPTEQCPAIAARRYQVFPNYSVSTNYSEFTSKENQAFYFWPDTVSFTIPVSSDVVSGFNYGTLTGSCVVPDQSAVGIEIPVSSPVKITDLIAGQRYEILNTDGISSFTSVGAPYDNVGTRFFALCSAPFGSSLAQPIGTMAPYENGIFWHTKNHQLSSATTLGNIASKIATVTELSAIIDGLTK